MLEIKNLTKIYKSTVKNGVDTKALNNITLSFPEKGMVFLLGKSGSGKSTLLNVCGGLDAPTSGEIIVKGKSSKDFSQSDFDSYRNTFIGFIFQEYNILNEFSVEDNIALALELQGKPKDKKAIAELLEQVDLSGFAKRKPNTLSGGQKQRIAIARALVKSPEIIMADEPTGALDSATGKQVFDTLKKLSRDKLVIIVSHDRDFAELYGDRIIELKDGQILSDISKAEQTQQNLSDSISTIGNVLCIKHGAELDESDFKQIKSFLQSFDSDVIIAKDEKDVAAFKKAARINDNGSKEYFADTDESKLDIKKYNPEDSKFIRSRLPMRHAAKIGVSSLRSKPFRLILTVLLCTVSFVLFGLLSTLNFYDSESMFKQTLYDSNREYVVLEKNYLANVKEYERGKLLREFETSHSTKFSDADIAKLSSTFGNDLFGANPVHGLEYSVRSINSEYWNNNISTIAYLPEGNAFRNKINGQYPEKDNEICISSYTAEMLIECKATDNNGNIINATTITDLIGKTVRISGESYKIVGIFDCGSLNSKYDDLKTATEPNYTLASNLKADLTDGTYLLTLLTKNEFDKISSRSLMSDMFYYNSKSGFLTLHTGNINEEKYEEPFPGYTYNDASTLAPSSVHYFNATNNTVDNNEIIVSDKAWVDAIRFLIEEKMREERENDKTMYETSDGIYNGEEAIPDNSEYLQELYSNINYYTIGFRTVYNPETGEPIEEITLTSDEKEKILKDLIEWAKDITVYADFSAADSSNTKISNDTRYTVTGIFINSDQTNSQKVFLSQSEHDRLWELQFPTLDYCTTIETDYKEDPDASYSLLYAPFTNTEKQKDLLWKMNTSKEYDSNATKTSLNGVYISKLSNIDSMVKNLSQVFLYVGLVFAAFSILLFSNFIATSISQKKREIGILRAVGARGTDVFKIFFSESFVIAFICALFANIGSALLCSLLNTSMAEEFGASLFVFGPISIIVIIGIAILTAIIATFIPVWNAARKKPVDSIRAL